MVSSASARIEAGQSSCNESLFPITDFLIVGGANLQTTVRGVTVPDYAKVGSWKQWCMYQHIILICVIGARYPDWSGRGVRRRRYFLWT